jgi:hypothetical protein
MTVLSSSIGGVAHATAFPPPGVVAGWPEGVRMRGKIGCLTVIFAFVAFVAVLAFWLSFQTHAPNPNPPHQPPTTSSTP